MYLKKCSTSIQPQIALSHFSSRPRSQKSRFCPLPVLLGASTHVRVGYTEWDTSRFCFSVHVQLRPDRIIALPSLACWAGGLSWPSALLFQAWLTRGALSAPAGVGEQEPSSSNARQVVPPGWASPQLRFVSSLRRRCKGTQGIS